MYTKRQKEIFLSLGEFFSKEISKTIVDYLQNGYLAISYDKFQLYNIDTDTTIFMPAPKNSPESQSATYWDGNLYISGGHLDYKNINQFLQYNFETQKWTELPSMILPRANHSSNAFQDRIYVIGGANEESTDALLTGEIFDIKTQTWSPFPSANTQLFVGHTGCLVGSRIYIIYIWNSYYFDCLTERWHMIQNIPNTTPQTIFINNRIYSITSYQQIDTYNPIIQKWETPSWFVNYVDNNNIVIGAFKNTIVIGSSLGHYKLDICAHQESSDLSLQATSTSAYCMITDDVVDG